MFDACYVINLDRRPDRYEAFCERLPTDWPFPTPTRYSAYDGRDALIVPLGWKATRGAFGCLLSHRSLLRRAAENFESILILEDDVLFRAGFSAKATALVDRCREWDQIYLGGQHVAPTVDTDIKGLRRCVKTQRTHAYAVSARGAARLLPIVDRADTHIDVYYARAQKDELITAYAPAVWLCGQAPGQSDVFGSKQPARVLENYWDEEPQ